MTRLLRFATHQLELQRQFRGQCTILLRRHILPRLGLALATDYNSIAKVSADLTMTHAKLQRYVLSLTQGTTADDVLGRLQAFQQAHGWQNCLVVGMTPGSPAADGKAAVKSVAQVLHTSDWNTAEFMLRSGMTIAQKMILNGHIVGRG